jgi:nitrogen fixation NifU-like protein
MVSREVEELYREVILDHYKNPHGAGLAEDYEAEVSHVNPSCGDEITLRLGRSASGELAVSYEANGCSISQASASVMHDLVDGEPSAESQRRYEAFHDLVTSRGGGEPDEATAELLEDGVAFAGVAQFPMRVKCALLPWMALQDALVRTGALTEEER